jgi:hypothetical protein
MGAGTHFDPETGLHHIEIVATTPSKQAAGAAGARLGERNVYNLATDENIPTGADSTLGRSPISVGLDDRMAELNAATPGRPDGSVVSGVLQKRFFKWRGSLLQSEASDRIGGGMSSRRAVSSGYSGRTKYE